MAAPFALTYTAPAAELPAWQSYTQSATLTTTAFWTYATLDAEGRQTLVSGALVQTAYGTRIVQLPITVDIPYSVGGIYTTAGGTGPTVVSVLGATGDITLGATSQVPPSASSTVFEATSADTSVTVTSATAAPSTTSASTLNTLPSTSALAPTASTASTDAITGSLPSPSTSSSASSSSASASTSSAPSSLASSSSPSSSPTTATSHSSSTHLARGKIAGIILGVIFLLLLILLLLFLLRRRRRRRRQLKRGSSGRSHEWDFTPAANSTYNTRRRSSAATGGSRGGLWGLAGLVGIGSSAGGSPSTGGEKTEKYGDIGAVREVVEDGEGFEGMAMMDESASPASIFPTVRGSGGGEYAAVGGAAGAVAAGRSASGGTRGSGEQGGLLDPFQEREVEEEEDDDEFRDEGRDYHTPVMPSGWAGAAAATGLLHGVGETWSGTPSTQASPARGERPPRAYPSFRISGTSTPPESPPPPIRRNRRGVPILSEFAWMRGRSDNFGGTASTNDSGSGSGGTGATRSSAGGTTNSGSGSRSGGATGSSGLEPGGSENQHSRGSRGTSMNDASPNISELFYNTPRWLGTRQPSSSSLGSPGSHYPDPPPDTPLMYPLAVTNSDPMRHHHRSREASHESTGSGPGSAREMRHRNSEGMLDRIAASFGMALSGLGIRQGRSRETSHEAEQSGGSKDRFTDTPPRITPRVASQPSTTGTPSLAPLRRSITTATFGQPTLGIPRSSSAASSSDNEAHARSYEAHDSFGQDFTPPKAGAGRGVGAPMWEANRLTATSFGTLGQHIDSSDPTRSPSPSEVLSDGDLGATTLGSHSHSHSHSDSGSQSHSHGHFSSSEHEPSSSQGSEAHSRLGSGGAQSAYDRRRNTLGRKVTVSEAGSGSGSGSGRSRSMRTTERSEGSSGNHSSGASHVHSASSGVPPSIPESETTRQGLVDR